MPKLTVEDLALEFKRPILVDENGCWVWLGSISTQGYAIYNQKPVYGILHTRLEGPCPSNMVLRHICFNKRCVNPSHVVRGTFTENMIDAVVSGDRGPIRERYAEMVRMAAKGMRQADIANKLHVSRSLVSLFFLGKIMCFKPEDFNVNLVRSSKQ